MLNFYTRPNNFFLLTHTLNGPTEAVIQCIPNTRCISEHGAKGWGEKKMKFMSVKGLTRSNDAPFFLLHSFPLRGSMSDALGHLPFLAQRWLLESMSARVVRCSFFLFIVGRALLVVVQFVAGPHGQSQFPVWCRAAALVLHGGIEPGILKQQFRHRHFALCCFAETSSHSLSSTTSTSFVFSSPFFAFLLDNSDSQPRQHGPLRQWQQQCWRKYLQQQ